ncbi:MAG: TonB-dependent hemoglobin/transferrin/lactoferrin family receptor [Paracoccaceae bacterium]
MIDLSPVTVYATRTEKQILDVPANVTVIPGERIEREMITDMQELMRYEPGIDVDRQTSSTDPFNTFGGFTIRGVGGNRTQILVDGSRAPERIIDGTRDYLDLDFTKQVDIIRGPGSVLWGSDALGGIVAIETVDPEDVLEDGDNFGGSLSMDYDSFNQGVDTSLTMAGRVSPKFAFLGGLSLDRAEEGQLNQARADGGIYGCPRNIAFGATPCNKLDPTKEESIRGLAKLIFTPNADHRVELSADIMNRKTDVDFNQTLGPVFSTITGLPTGETILDYDRTLDLNRKRFAIEHDWEVGASWLDSLNWRVAYAPQDYTRSGDELSDAATGERLRTQDFLGYSEDFLEFDIQFNSSFNALGAQHVLTYGFDGDYTTTDYKRSDTVNDLTNGTVTETRGGGFNFANADTLRADFYLQDEITFFDGRVTLLPGFRYSTYSLNPRTDADYQAVPGQEPSKVSDEALTAKLGLTVRIDDNFSVYGQYAQGFKMPTAQQLYTSLPGAFFNLTPAPDLKPETVDSYELGLRGEFQQGWFSVNGFYADYDDFIQSFFNPPGTNDFTYRNLSAVQVWGVEASAHARITENLRSSMSLSWQKGKQKVDAATPSTPFDVPPLQATIGLGYDIPSQGLSFDIVGNFATKVTRASSPTLFKPDGYAVFDGYARWEIAENVSLNAGLLNIFNARYFAAPFPNSFDVVPTQSVARSNPLELQTAPGRTFRLGLDVKF